jgi:hypothetical protein
MVINRRHFTINTIAGKQKFTISDVFGLSVDESGQTALLLLRNGERWAVNVDDLISVLSDNAESDELKSQTGKLRAVSLPDKFRGGYR